MKQSAPIRSLALAALLACAGVAHAQSSVQLYGLVDLSVGSFQGPGASSVKKVEPGGMTTSYWGLRGQEDLGGNLSAVFAAEGFFLADTGASGRFGGDNFFARNAYVGLTSPTLGTLQAGRNTTLLFLSTIVFNAFGDSYTFSPTVRHVYLPSAILAPVTGDSGWSDSVLYSTPSFGGLKLSALAAAGEGNGGRNWSASASYGIGSFAATAVVQDAKKDISSTVAVTDTRTWQLGASYDFGFAKLFVQHTHVDNRTDARRDAKLIDVSAAVPVSTAGKVLVAYGVLDRASNSLERDLKTFSLGYDHYLSKRTDVYVAAMHDKAEGLSAGKSYAVGIRHRF